MKAKVALKHCDTYTKAIVYQKIKEAINSIGGIATYVNKGQKVLIKPNILLGKDPNKAVTTNPNFLWAIIKLVQEEGGIVFVGDSPGFGLGKKAAKQCGILDIIDELGATWVEFNNPTNIPGLENGIFKYFTVDKKLTEMDVIINLPKLKTHFMTYMTLSVKNLYGCLIGPQKRQWTIQANKNKTFFSKLLVEFSEKLKPQLTIIDGIMGMEGEGPANGLPRYFNIIAASDNCTALDRVICEILQVDPQKVSTLRAAKEINRGVYDLENIDLKEKNIKNYKIDNIKLPEITEIKDNYFTRITSKILKKSLTTKPVIDNNICDQCQACYNNCPMSAIVLEDSTNPQTSKKNIDYDSCILCMHCEEICPKGAITQKKGWLQKYFSK